MKKTIFSFLLILSTTFFGCVIQDYNTDVVPIGPPPNIEVPNYPGGGAVPFTAYNLDALKNVYATNVSENYAWMDAFIWRFTDTKLYLNEKRLYREQALKMAQHFAAPSDFNVSDVAYQVAIAPKYVFGATDPIKVSSVPGAYNKYNSAQLAYMDQYFEYAGNFTGSGFFQVSNKKASVITLIKNSSAMTNAQKLEAQAAIEYAHSFAAAWWNQQKYNLIKIDIETASSSSASSDCKVNWREVWATAVVGGVVGGIKGAYAGATVGTFTIPGLGTATGALGGGVFGFALGFAGSAGSKIAVDLLLSCFRSTKLAVPSDMYCAQLPPLLQTPENCPLELNEIDWVFSITPNLN